MERHAENAASVVKFLSAHPKVERVLYPGLPDHPGHEIAKRQAKGYGGMLSFLVKGGEQEARTFLSSVKVFTLAESLGG
ncbi:PLP-dependent transferase, partial [Acinetobacter baumannii]